MHATYQFEDAADCAFGKRERFREWGLWLDPPPATARAAAYLGGGGAPQEGGRAADRAAAQEGGQEAAQQGGQQGGQKGGHEEEETFLVLHDESTIPAAERWSGQADPHARGRQHVAHLNHFRRRLARGVALARLLNRTVVLPRFWCYCDKYWSRLSQCTVGEQPQPQPQA